MLKIKRRLFLLLLLFLQCGLTQEGMAVGKYKYITIATGSVTGVYYPTGGALCRLVNRGRQEHGIRCAAESTGGSVANLNALRDGKVEFAIVQSDWHYHSYTGSGFFADQPPFRELRSVASLYDETFTLVVTEKSGIRKLDDILGKKVNFGPLGSGVNATMEMLMRVRGWKKADFAAVTYLTPAEQPKALCEDRIDVMLYVAGNPNGILQEVTQYPGCKAMIINIDRPTIQMLTERNPFYVKAVIPGGMYRNNPADIETFGTKATLVTTASVEPEVVYNVVKALFDNFDDFKTLHPVFASLNKQDSVRQANSAPFHNGAIEYYKEAGL